jgi:hypothetical protein
MPRLDLLRGADASRVFEVLIPEPTIEEIRVPRLVAGRVQRRLAQVPRGRKVLTNVAISLPDVAIRIDDWWTIGHCMNLLDFTRSRTGSLSEQLLFWLRSRS